MGRTEVRHRTPGPFDVLPASSHAFHSTSSMIEATASAVRCARMAVGFTFASAGLSVPDWTGRLRLVSSSGDGLGAGRRRSAKRRAAFEDRRPARFRLRHPSGSDLAILPLLSREEPVGVLEVVAPRGLLDERWATLQALADQAAIVVRDVSRQAELERAATLLNRATYLVRDLVRAPTPDAAVRAAVALCHTRLGLPTAAWLVRGDPDRLKLVAVHGLGRRRRDELRAAVPFLPPWGRLAGADRVAVEARVAAILGVAEMVTVDAGDAVVLVGGRPSDGAVLEVAGSLIHEVIHHLQQVARAERRTERLDLGLACTAHEVRAPLAAARMAVDRLLLTAQEREADRTVLKDLKHELDRMLETVEPLLRWSVGAAHIRRRHIDLVRLVRQAVTSCLLEAEADADRVRLDAPPSVKVFADAKQLRSALTNVVRNALGCSPPDEPVRVTVEVAGSEVVVLVRDTGPGVLPEEREAIFDPFVRGQAGAGRFGQGLGLFIAKRVVEAHRGRIWVTSNGHGATFGIRLAHDGQERRATSAS